MMFGSGLFAYAYSGELVLRVCFGVVNASASISVGCLTGATMLRENTALKRPRGLDWHTVEHCGGENGQHKNHPGSNLRRL